MSFTQVTITHDFDLPPGALGTVVFTPVEPMHNAGQTAAGTVTATLDSTGALSQMVDATTDPGTTPLGVPYRIVLRISGQPPVTWYTPVPHNQGSSVDLSTLLTWAAATGGGVVTSVQGVTGDVVLTADDIGDGDINVSMTGSERSKLAGIAPAATNYSSENARDDIAATLVAGANVTITPDDAGDRITIAATGSGGGGSYTDEQVRDVIGAALVAGANVTITPNDAADTITISAATTGSSGIPASTVTAKGDTLAATGSGAVARVPVGSNGQVLTANSALSSGVGWVTPPAYTDEQAQDAAAALFTGGTHSGITFAYNDTANTVSATVSGGSSYTDAQARAATPVYLPSDHGYLAWSVDPATAGNSTQLNTGVLYLIEVKIVAAATVSAVDLNIATAGSGLANCYVALYNASGSRLGVSASQASSWNSGGSKSVALGSSASVTAGKHYVGLLVGSASSAPSISRASTSVITNIGRTAPFRSSTSGSGLTAAPASVTLTSVTAANDAWFIGLK